MLNIALDQVMACLEQHYHAGSAGMRRLRAVQLSSHRVRIRAGGAGLLRRARRQVGERTHMRASPVSCPSYHAAGSGLSSSSALVCAAALAFLAAYQIRLPIPVAPPIFAFLPHVNMGPPCLATAPRNQWQLLQPQSGNRHLGRRLLCLGMGTRGAQTPCWRATHVPRAVSPRERWRRADLVVMLWRSALRSSQPGARSMWARSLEAWTRPSPSWETRAWPSLSTSSR